MIFNHSITIAAKGWMTEAQRETLKECSHSFSKLSTGEMVLWFSCLNAYCATMRLIDTWAKMLDKAK